MSASRFVDTNVLIYSISNLEAEAPKRRRAQAVLDRGDWGLSVQVVQEFYVQATRASRLNPLSHDNAVDWIALWLRAEVQDNTLAVLRAALEIKAKHRFSYWDSAIIAAARALGCRELYTEDMAHGRQIEGVTIINPFR